MFFFNDPATTEIYTLSLHDTLPIFDPSVRDSKELSRDDIEVIYSLLRPSPVYAVFDNAETYSAYEPDGIETFYPPIDRKSTRLNSSHANISYAAFCLKKKNIYRLIG